jgi:hypothetical protein
VTAQPHQTSFQPACPCCGDPGYEVTLPGPSVRLCGNERCPNTDELPKVPEAPKGSKNDA